MQQVRHIMSMHSTIEELVALKEISTICSYFLADYSQFTVSYLKEYKDSLLKIETRIKENTLTHEELEKTLSESLDQQKKLKSSLVPVLSRQYTLMTKGWESLQRRLREVRNILETIETYASKNPSANNLERIESPELNTLGEILTKTVHLKSQIHMANQIIKFCSYAENEEMQASLKEAYQSLDKKIISATQAISNKKYLLIQRINSSSDEINRLGIGQNSFKENIIAIRQLASQFKIDLSSVERVMNTNSIKENIAV